MHAIFLENIIKSCSNWIRTRLELKIQISCNYQLAVLYLVLANSFSLYVNGTIKGNDIQQHKCFMFEQFLLEELSNHFIDL